MVQSLIVIPTISAGTNIKSFEERFNLCLPVVAFQLQELSPLIGALTCCRQRFHRRGGLTGRNWCSGDWRRIDWRRNRRTGGLYWNCSFVGGNFASYFFF